MPSSHSRLQEVLKDLLAYHPAAKVTGADHFARIFCDTLSRCGSVTSVTGNFEGNDAVFSIRVPRTEEVFRVYDGLRFGLQTFFLTSDYGCNPDRYLVVYRLRNVRDSCRRCGTADNALAFGFELAGA
jgi:hypothetical protein